jgi:uncharacterized membrane protein
MNKRSLLRLSYFGLLLVLVSCNAQEAQPPDRLLDTGTGAVAREIFSQIVGWIVLGIEASGVTIILAGIILSMIYFLSRWAGKKEELPKAYDHFRRLLGRAIILGLEFLVAADIIRTVAVEPTFANLGVLGFLVVIRTFLSFAMEIEITGRLPWQQPAKPLDVSEDQEESSDEN